MLIEFTDHGTESGASTEQAGGLVGGQPDGIFFRDIHVAKCSEWDQFALDHVLREVDQDVEHVEVTFFERDLERLHVQPVACQYAAMIAPTGIGRGASAARVSTIDDVVVDQRGAVDQFDNGGKPDGAASVGFAARCSPATKQQ